MQFSPKKFSGTHQGDRGFFSICRSNSDSQPALLHVENSVGRVALHVGHLVLLKMKNFSAQPSSREKGLGIENRHRHSWVAAWRFEAGKAFQFRHVAGFARSHRSQPMEPVWLDGLCCRVGMALALISHLRRADLYTSP